MNQSDQLRIDLNQDLLLIIEKDFKGLYSGELGISSIAGGQSAGNAALSNLDITGYANQRSQVYPKNTRGASVLSPYIRHNILTLAQVYKAVSNAPFRDREKYQDELFWQEYARHLYARVGVRLFENLRYQVNAITQGDGWNREMLCIDEMVSELESDGWLVNQSRMWLASHWTVRNDKSWLVGQERMHQNLIDGSRAANLLGWQWTAGAGTGKPYGFAKWQVDKRAPGLCLKCSLKSNCPINDFPDEQSLHQLSKDTLLDNDPNLSQTTGPITPVVTQTPTHVLLTIDSLGDDDAALSAHQDLPAVFVFNQQSLLKLQLSARRIAFYLQTLADLSQRRELLVYLGDPVKFVQDNPVALTYAPVPSFKKYQNIAALYPYPWLKKPHAGSVRSFSSWRGKQ